MALCQELLSYLPSNNLEDPPDLGNGEVTIIRDESLNELIPDEGLDPISGFPPFKSSLCQVRKG